MLLSIVYDNHAGVLISVLLRFTLLYFKEFYYIMNLEKIQSKVHIQLFRHNHDHQRLYDDDSYLNGHL